MNSVTKGEVVSTREGVQVRKQDCYVGDSSGCLKVVLWEDDVGSMETGMSYKVEGAVVKSFDGFKYLSKCMLMKLRKMMSLRRIVALLDVDV